MLYKEWTKSKNIDIHKHYIKYLIYKFICDILSIFIGYYKSLRWKKKIFLVN